MLCIYGETDTGRLLAVVLTERDGRIRVVLACKRRWLNRLFHGLLPSKPPWLPSPDVEKARELATRKGIGYQTLLKMLVHEGCAARPNERDSQSRGLVKLQQELIAAVAPFTVKTGTAAAYVTTSENAYINEPTLDYVAGFVSNATGKHFNPPNRLASSRFCQ